MKDPKTLETFMGFLPNRKTPEVLMYYTLRGFARDAMLYVSVPKLFDESFGDKPFIERFPGFHVCGDDEPNIYGASIMDDIVVHNHVNEYAACVGTLSQETIDKVFGLAFDIENELVDMRKNYLEDLSMDLVVSIIEGSIEFIQHDIIEPYGVSDDIMTFHNELIQVLPFVKRYKKDLESIMPERRVLHETRLRKLLEDLSDTAMALFEKYSGKPIIHALAPFITHMHSTASKKVLNRMRDMDRELHPLSDDVIRELEEIMGIEKK